MLFLKAKMGAFTEYCKRRKASGTDKERSEGKNKAKHQKGISGTNGNTTNRKTEPCKKKQVLLTSENNTNQENKVKAGDHIVGHPLKAQVTVSTSPGRSAMAGVKKRTPNLPATNKRLKQEAE